MNNFHRPGTIDGDVIITCSAAGNVFNLAASCLADARIVAHNMDCCGWKVEVRTWDEKTRTMQPV